MEYEELDNRNVHKVPGARWARTSLFSLCWLTSCILQGKGWPPTSQPASMLAPFCGLQGTGAVVTSGFVNGMKYQKTDLKDARIVFYGAGSSAVGVADSIATYMQKVDLLSCVCVLMFLRIFEGF